MRKSTALFLAISLLLVPGSVWAWGSAGHILIAGEAYRELTPQLKAQSIEVLKAHPDYQKWMNAYHPNANFDQFAYIFMRSSTWPDEIRRSRSKYDHPNWHFIDYPLRPPQFAFEPDARPTDNVLYGIAEAERTLSDAKADPELRAAMMSYLIHLVGDEHQPLHCESFFDLDYPEGDKGGNSFYVVPAKAVVGLHSIWDGLLGSSANPREQWNYGIELQAKFPRTALPELTAHASPKEWSLESRQLAVDRGYLRGELRGSTNRDSAPELPAGYTRNAKMCAERQGALAGYRLADEIQHWLKCDGVVPLLPQFAFTNSQVALPAKIGTAQASKYYDQDMVVTGKVVQVTARPTVTFIDLDGSGRSSPFTAVIFPDNLSKFGDLQKLQGQDVQISGTVTEYRGKPEMVLEKPGQISAQP